MTTKADVIVIGSGAFGCGAAWHLRQRGLDVLVIEAAEGPATQASRAAAGFISSWSIVHERAWGQCEWEMQRYGIQFYTRLAETCGHDIGFYPCGIAYIYLTEKDWSDVQDRIDRARALGTRLEILTEARAAMILPQVRFTATRGIVFDPDSIRIRAAQAIPALAEQLKQQGVQFLFDTPVTSFLCDDHRVRGVVTSAGEFASEHVVVAAGAWSRPLLRQLGIACPAEPHTETRYTTKPLMGVGPEMPLLIFSDCHWFYMREEHGGMLIGGFEDEPLPADRRVDPENPPRADKIVSRQPHRVREFVREIEHVMPVLKDAEVNETMSGLPTFTDDLKFIAGRVPPYDGLYIMAACQEGGVTHGPGLGKMIAELIVDGGSAWDQDAYHIDRFSELAPVTLPTRP
jgi:glycine/D-amino acid oxidase-like deaminating enzyme